MAKEKKVIKEKVKEEKKKEAAAKKEANELRSKFQQFQKVSVHSKAMLEYSNFMKNKMKPMHVRKEPDRDLGLAAIDSTVMLE